MNTTQHFHQQYWSGGPLNDVNPCPECQVMLRAQDPVVTVTSCVDLDACVWPREVGAILCQPCGLAAANKAGQAIVTRNPSVSRTNPWASQVSEWDRQAEIAKAAKEARAAKARQRKRPT